MSRLIVKEEFDESSTGCPVLTCDLLLLRSKVPCGLENEEGDILLQVGVFGNTAGSVSVWLLSGSIIPDRTQSTGR